MGPFIGFFFSRMLKIDLGAMPNIFLGGVAGEAFNAIDNYLESRRWSQ